MINVNIDATEITKDTGNAIATTSLSVLTILAGVIDVLISKDVLTREDIAETLDRLDAGIKEVNTGDDSDESLKKCFPLMAQALRMSLKLDKTSNQENQNH